LYEIIPYNQSKHEIINAMDEKWKMVERKTAIQGEINLERKIMRKEQSINDLNFYQNLELF
jgi:hypothetical protein